MAIMTPLSRVLEPEVMDSAAEARDYDAMDHAAVNHAFVSDLLTIVAPRDTGPRDTSRHGEQAAPLAASAWQCLDVGTGTAQIPIELCRQDPHVRVVATDLAEHMLRLARGNVARANLSARIDLRRLDAKSMPFADGSFGVVMSNSIVHHIPEPRQALQEMVRVLPLGGKLFVRDLLRPADERTVGQLVQTYAGRANAHQQAMFAASLRAALTLEEMRRLVHELGFRGETVQQTSDRHWTWTCRRVGF